jgi:hypothetical protein
MRVVVCLLLVGCQLPPSPEPAPPPRPVPPPPVLDAPVVRQELSTQWCDRGPRSGRLLWDAVAGAVRYQVDLVDASACCDDQYATWPEARWAAGQHVMTRTPAIPSAEVSSIYYRARAIAADGRYGRPAFGMWECWWE